MNTLLQHLRHLARRAARAWVRAAPYLVAADPSRPPPAALWPDAWRPEPGEPRLAPPAAAAAQPAPAACCPQCA